MVVKKRSDLYRNKKAYFFTLDALLAITVMILGFILVFSAGSKVPSTAQLNYYAEDLMTLMSSTKIYEINNVYVDELYEAGDITNRDFTILEQAGEFYYKFLGSIPCEDDINPDCGVLLGDLLDEVSSGAIPDRFDVGIKISELSGTDPASVELLDPIPQESDTGYDILVTSRKIISGVTFNEGNYESWTYGVQIRVWQPNQV